VTKTCAPLPPASDQDIARFLALVEVLPCGCWYWTGARSRGKNRSRKWYGTFWYGGRRVRAHRFADEVLGGRGSLPPGHHRDHTCVFSMCVNVGHIERVTHAENERRRVERGRERAAALSPFTSPSGTGTITARQAHDADGG
jgi:hypothetical protein